MNNEPHHNREATEYLFGPFRFNPTRRILLCEDIPQRLGGRAIDILAILLERPSELVSKRELIARVWPTTVVEDGNLKVHVAALRRILGEFQQGSHYISTINGRGYCFVAPVHANSMPQPAMSGSVLSGPVDQLIVTDMILCASGEPRRADSEPGHRLATLAVESDTLEPHGLSTFDPADLPEATIAHVREQIGFLQSAVEVLESERDRDRKELQSLRKQLEAAISAPQGAWAVDLTSTPDRAASSMLILPMHMQDSWAVD